MLLVILSVDVLESVTDVAAVVIETVQLVTDEPLLVIVLLTLTLSDFVLGDVAIATVSTNGAVCKVVIVTSVVELAASIALWSVW